jgi:hypothetical protein
MICEPWLRIKEGMKTVIMSATEGIQRQIPKVVRT